MKRIGIAALLLMVLAAGCSTAVKSRGAFFNVRNFGAAGDGVNLDHTAINKAVEVCAAAGGGTVYLPAGTYLSGSIRLKSNTSLYLDAGATILGASNDIGVYDPPEGSGFPSQYQDFGHSHWHNSLIWGEGLENIAIIGQGKIHGGGMTAGQYGRFSKDPAPGGGDKAIALKLCRNITIKDITIQHAGHFAILPTGCDNMTIDNVKIDTNRDGINLDCCRNVRVSNCIVNSPRDDGICPKSSYALGFPRATENVTITNCIVSGFKEGTMLDGTYVQRAGGTGRIKFGTESNGGFKNVVIDNCVFRSCRGLALEVVDGGVMENISISNITMKDIGNSPIFIRLGDRRRGPKETTSMGVIRNVSISNITATDVDSACGSIISGVPGGIIEDVRLSNIKITYRGGGTAEDVARVVPENVRDYPEPAMFGRLPSYGFYCRHAKGLQFRDIQVGFDKEDVRPALLCDDVTGLEIDNFQAQRATANEAMVLFKDVKDVTVRNSPELGIENTR